MNKYKMSTPELKNKIDALKQDMYSNIIKPRQINGDKLQPSHISLFKYPYFYTIPPIVLFCLLLLWRPKFMYQSKDVKGINVDKFSFKRFFYTWIVLSVFVCGLLFAKNSGLLRLPNLFSR
jgi:hypothetical protein